MTAQMTKRERVERTMAFQETDRVPLYDLLRCDHAFEHFSGEKLPPLAPEDSTQKRLGRIVGKAVDNLLDMTRSVAFGPLVEEDVTDEFGFVNHSSPHEKTSWIIRRPFDDEAGAAEFLKQWVPAIEKVTNDIRSNPSPYGDNYRQHFLEIQATIGDTVNLLAQHGVGLDEVRHRLGLEIFSYVQADNPGLISAVLDAFTEQNIAICHAVADLSLSPAVLTYGDIAYKNGLLHSPAYLRQEFFPRLKRLNDAWHEHGFKCLFHSDGNLMEVMDDLIAAGADGLNPIETVAGMNLKEIRERYGRKFFLAGGIDMSQLLSLGTPEQVRETCRQAINDAYPGFFMGSTTELDNSSRLENILAMYHTATEGVR